MGVDIAVLVVDPERLTGTPRGERLRLLRDAVSALDDEGDRGGGGGGAGADEGWAWPARAGTPWYGVYRFPGTLDSFKPHFWAGEAWERVRGHAGPALRSALDTFLSGLFWDGPWPPEDGDGGDGDGGLLPRRRVMVACPPEDVPALAAAWREALPLLDGLAEPFAVHAARPSGWTRDFAEFRGLLHDWAEVVDEAGRRGWAVVGLVPY
ncbi:hypothetical protein GCM10027168_62960 [Streptomyces capparidis]